MTAMFTGIGLPFLGTFIGVATVAFWWMGRPIREVCHPAPKFRLTVERAHEVMQELIDCDAERCAGKRAAFQTLVDEGHAVPGRRR